MIRNTIKIHKCMSFDWDDNILHMPTKIKMDKKIGDDWSPIEVEPAEFALIRGDKENYRIRGNDPVQAFDEFVDFGPRGDNAFLEDVITAISNNQYGPSWHTLINCLINANLFGIVTSRSHEYTLLRKGVEYIIDNILSIEEKRKMYINCCDFRLSDIMLDSIYTYDLRNAVDKIDLENLSVNKIVSKYLDTCKYYGVGLPFSNSFKNDFNITDDLKISIQEAKKMALGRLINISDDMFTKVYTNGDLEIFHFGFSDDDKKTTELIKEFFNEKSKSFRGAKLCVYDTSDRKIKGGMKTKFHEQYNHGKELQIKWK